MHRLLACSSLVFFLCSLGLAAAQNTTIDSFKSAKRQIAPVFADRRVTFYCGCTYEGKRVALDSCGYEIISDEPRAQRLEWEHVVPASSFGQSFAAWRDGHPDCVDSRGRPFKGRNCARKTAIEFRMMEGDLYNLQPAIGEVNGRRSNFSMGMIEDEPRKFGDCDVEIEDRNIEPRPAIRGDIARTYFYMEQAYPGRGIISGRNRPLFEAWDRADPVDNAERELAQRIERIQGNRNTFVLGDAPPEPAPPQPAAAAAVRGNRRSKIYHRSDCPGFGRISAANRVAFADEAAAQAAGFRLAGNCP